MAPCSVAPRSAENWPRAELVTAAAILLTTIGVTVWTAGRSVAGLAGSDVGILPSGDLDTFLHILSRNLLASLGLFSGAVTFGLGSLVFLLLIGLMLGLSIGASIEVLGVAQTILRAWAYTPLELAGFVMAAAAGLTPVRQRLLPAERRTPAPLARALRRLLAAWVVIVAAAAVETLSIALARS